MNNEQKLAAWAREHKTDDSPEVLIREWANCHHAELHQDGSVYIENPQAGHYLKEHETESLCKWLTLRGVFAADNVKASHTPGPWRIGASYRTADIMAGHNAIVARVEIESAGDRGLPNVRLIAAAPDLLAALECIARGMTNGQRERGETAESIARAAIAKATA